MPAYRSAVSRAFRSIIIYFDSMKCSGWRARGLSRGQLGRVDNLWKVWPIDFQPELGREIRWGAFD